MHERKNSKAKKDPTKKLINKKVVEEQNIFENINLFPWTED